MLTMATLLSVSPHLDPNPSELRLLMIGDIGVGKTSVLHVFTEKQRLLKQGVEINGDLTKSVWETSCSASKAGNYRPLRWKQSIVAYQHRRMLQIVDTAGMKWLKNYCIVSS